MFAILTQRRSGTHCSKTMAELCGWRAELAFGVPPYRRLVLHREMLEGSDVWIAGCTESLLDKLGDSLQQNLDL